MRLPLLRLLLPLVTCAGLAACATTRPQAQTPDGAEPVAKRWVGHLAAAEYDAAGAMLSQSMREALPGQKLREVWEGTLKKHGAFQGQGTPQVERKGDLEAVLIPAEFQAGSLVLRVVIDREQRVTGFFLAPPKTSPAALAAGARFVSLLASGDWTAAVGMLDAKMAKVLPAPGLEALWTEQVTRSGPLREQLGPKGDPSGQADVVQVGCEFEKASLTFEVVVSRGDGKVSGLWIKPRYRSSPHVRRDRFEETAVVVGGPPWTLPGTLTMPKGDGPFAAVVLVHGSGPNDRDESILAQKPFRDLAEGLGTRGIAVLRYDKRTLVHREKLGGIPRFTPKEEAIDDAVEAVTLLARTAKIDPKRIFVLGHSRGGQLAPRILQAAPAVAGGILLAGSTRRIEVVLQEQLDYLFKLDGKVDAEEQAALDQLARDTELLRDPKLSPEHPGVIQGAPASYWLDLHAHHAPTIASALPQPLLVLQGERDYQVTMEDLAAWKAALGTRKDVEFCTYPRLNHLFTEGPGPKSTPNEYREARNVPEAVLDDLAGWIGRH